MLLTALENTLLDYTAYVSDEFLKEHGFQKGGFQGISTELRKNLEQRIKFSRTTGGSAANVCHGFVNLGMQAAFIGSVGNDENGKFYGADLEKAGIAHYFHVKRGPNGVCMVLVTPDKERTMAVNMGKSSSLWPWNLHEADIENSDFFHTTAYALDSMYLSVKRAMKIAKRHNVKISFDLASAKSIQRHRKKIDYLLEKYVNIVFANEEEAAEYTGKSPRDSMFELSEKHIAVVKLGSKGALVGGPVKMRNPKCKGSNFFRVAVPAYKVAEVKNTNGAGDAFAAGFLYGIAKDMNLYNAGRIGAYYAARVVEAEEAKLRYRISNIEELI
ncbi:MAG: adenosine kinase [Nanoarchaeota archaeon]|nr:adenosine kinase [Nanoarchaeota archaeon]